MLRSSHNSEYYWN